LPEQTAQALGVLGDVGVDLRVGAAEEALAVGRPSITVGGKRLWRNRHHLDQAGLAEREWRNRWDAARMFLTADGESGKAGGNETIRVDEAGRLRIKVPDALSAQFGSHLHIAAPVRFSRCGGEWGERVAGRSAVRSDITYDPAKGRWYLDASWKQDVIAETPSIEELRTGPVLGVDLNADHLACCTLDDAGNPVGAPFSIRLETAGLPASRRDGRVRAAIIALLEVCAQHDCTAVVIENLPSTGQNPCSSRLPTRSPGITPRRPRSGDGASAWRSGDGRQDPATDRGPLRARHRPGPITHRATWVGTAVPAHRHAHDAYRSTGEHLPPAAKTVRAAPEQTTLLLRHEERLPTMQTLRASVT
jgi:hypothetical protein